MATAAPIVAWQGTLRYEARSPTLTGASAEFEVRPARHVQLLALSPTGEEVGRSSADAEGRFRLDAPADATTLRVVARIDHDGHDLAVSRDMEGLETHHVDLPLGELALPTEHLLTDAAAGGPAGVFHILDTLYLGVTTVRAWTEQTVPPFFAYWGRGVTTDWSYYRGERPSDSGRYGIELLGGDAGAQASTDTDEHDEAIVLHELGHFVMDVLSTDSSPGGDHPAGFLVDPGLAWEEGRASWFATSVLGDPRYQDTIGISPQGRLRVNHDYERGVDVMHGLGSEQGVAEVLWDLSDGTPPAGEVALDDQDDDPVALGPAAVLRAMIALDEEEGAYPAVSTLLRYLVREDIVSLEAMKMLLVRGGHPGDLLPPDDVSLWPIDLALGDSHGAKIDAMSNPAPSGGPPRPSNGFDAVHVFRVHVTEAGTLRARLRILGSGRVADHQDLDLELRTTRASLLAQSATEKRVESIDREVLPGHYILYVRDGGQGNRVPYVLTVTVDPTPA